jgi:ATP-dependent DNA helicase RecG
MGFEKRLNMMLSQPEGQFIEFKRSVSNHLNREMVAFANSGGGHIIVGIDNDRKVVGISNINSLISRLESIARGCDPPVPLKITAHTRNGKEILLVEIPDGEDKPYSCASGFYLRSGATTQKMTRDEIVEFLYSVGQVRWDEKPCMDFYYPDDFDEKAFRYFLDSAGVSSTGMSIEDILVNIGVAKQHDERLIFTNTGVLFFAREPIRFLRHATVDCVLLAGTDKVHILDRKELKGNLMENVKQAMIFLKMHLPLKYEITGLKRKEILEIPEEVLREAVLNAVMHRDYHFESANISVEVYRDRVEISDPGGLPPGMKPEDLGKKSVRRNAMIADFFHRIGAVEKIGSGITRMKEMMVSSGLPEPRYEFTSFFTVIFERKPQVTTERAERETLLRRVYEGVHEGVGEGVHEGVKVRLSREILKIYEQKSIKRKEIEQLFTISTATAERDIAMLKEAGFLRFEGAPRTGNYVLTEKAKKMVEELGYEF